MFLYAVKTYPTEITLNESNINNSPFLDLFITVLYWEKRNDLRWVVFVNFTVFIDLNLLAMPVSVVVVCISVLIYNVCASLFMPIDQVKLKPLVILFKQNIDKHLFDKKSFAWHVKNVGNFF